MLQNCLCRYLRNPAAPKRADYRQKFEAAYRRKGARKSNAEWGARLVFSAQHYWPRAVFARHTLAKAERAHEPLLIRAGYSSLPRLRGRDHHARCIIASGQWPNRHRHYFVTRIVGAQLAAGVDCGLRAPQVDRLERAAANSPAPVKTICETACLGTPCVTPLYARPAAAAARQKHHVG